MYLVFVLKWVKSLIVRNLMNLTDETWGGWYLLLQLALPEGISSDEIYLLVQKSNYWKFLWYLYPPFSNNLVWSYQIT